MPVYEYACEKCGHEFEAEQRITEAPLKTCPRCRARKVRRLISQTSFVLKGGGWYSDLYSSSKGKKDEGAGAGKESGAAEAKADTKGESKAEPKAEPSAGSGEKGEPKADKPGSKGPKGKRGSAKAA
jgi:putative FmdB family regulatory protein